VEVSTPGPVGRRSLPPAVGVALVLSGSALVLVTLYLLYTDGRPLGLRDMMAFVVAVLGVVMVFWGAVESYRSERGPS
jgi:drug/metabolite transporter (DMT)-like permease